MGVLIEPFLDDASDINILVVEINHAHSGDSGGRSIEEGVSLKDEAGSIGEVNSLACGQSQQVIIIQHTVQRLHPFRINISIQDYPIVSWVFDHLPC